MNKNQLVISNIVESEEHCYPEFLQSIKDHFNYRVASNTPLFTTEVEG